MPPDPADHSTPERPLLVAGARRLFPLRFVLLSIYLLGMGGCYTFFSVVDEPVGFKMPPEALVVGTLILAILQAAFLTGLPQFRWPRPTGRRPMMLSIAAGALVAALLSAGLAGTFISLMQADDAFGAMIQRLGGQQATLLDLPWPYFAFLGLSWLLWLLIFSIAFAGRWVRKFKWIYRTLIAGTWLELLITIPVDIEVRKRTKCYCGEGTFFAMAVGITMAFWTFGPGLVVLLLTRRIQRRSTEPICTGCGYDLRGLTEPRCPECGQRFSRKILHV